MKAITQELAYLWLKITHKVYQVKYYTHGKNLRIGYIAVKRREAFDTDTIVESLAASLRLKPEMIRIQSINRAHW